MVRSRAACWRRTGRCARRRRLRRRNAAGEAATAAQSGAAPRAIFTTLRGGMQQLIDALDGAA